MYSNEAFALIGLALAKIAGTELESLFNETLAKPLGLSSTYYAPPNGITEHDVIPGTPLATGWSDDLGVFSP